MVTSEPPVRDQEKREALEAALGSDTFSRCAQLRAFLRYVCEREMEGRSAELTEYHIAVDVLGRRKDVSLSDDSSVRNRAYELRQRLEKFYSAEDPGAGVRIVIPRGGYVPQYTRPAIARAVAAASVPIAQPVAAAPIPMVPPASAGRPSWLRIAAVAVALAAGGGACYWAGAYFGRPLPPAVVRSAWGPLAETGDDLLIAIATNMHMLVRPHIAPHAQRLPAPESVYPLYGSNRPLQAGSVLYMQPAQLSVPIGELAAAVTLSNMRAAFGGAAQILPESEAPVTAMRGRNAALIGSGTNSQAATLLLRNLPLTIDYTPDDRFAVLDQRKPTGQNVVFVSQPTGDPGLSTSYGLISVITTAGPSGKPKRTLVISGASSAGVQAAVEFFSSASHLQQLKNRFAAAGLNGFPAVYQVIVRCRTLDVRLISYEYAGHEIVQRSIDPGR
jgi:hypothetical protein